MSQPPQPSSATIPIPAGVPYVSAAQASALLRSGLAIAGELLGESFQPMTRVVIDDLAARWDLGANGQIVLRLLQARGADLRNKVALKLRARQDQALAEVLKRPAESQKPSITADSLSLLDSADASASMVVDRAAARMRGIGEEGFRDLHMIVQHLVGRGSLRVIEDPFAAEVFVGALLDAAIDLSLYADSWDLLATAFEKPLANEVARIHQSLLEHFRKHGIDARAVRREMAARQQFERAGAAHNTRVQPPTLLGAEEAFTTVQGRARLGDLDLNLPAGPARNGPPPVLDGPMDPALYAGGRVPPGARLDLPRIDPNFVLTQLLARMQSSVTDAVQQSQPGRFAPSSAAGEPLLHAVGELQQLGLEGLAGASIAGGQPGTINAWREHLVEKSSRTVDKLTIEIVGLMFDHVLQDPQVPAEIKMLLSRLQFPVLKAALMDADFFASNTHPARKLIDRVATASAGWEPYGDENERFRSEIERLVKEVLQKFDKDVAVFERLLTEFETFLGEIAPRENDPVARAKRALEEAEKREVLVINTTIQVRRAFERVELDPELRDFLVGPWVQVLVEASMRDAQTPGFSKRFREAIHDLVWSVQPKANNEDRRRLTQMIPNLIRVLRDGMALARMPEHDQQGFLRKLMEQHAIAVKPVDQATYIRTSLVSSEVKAQIEGIQLTGTHPITTIAGGFRVSTNAVMRAAEQFDADLHIPSPVTDIGNLDRVEEARMDEEIAGWQRGSWFEMYNGKEKVKVRLRWISPLRTLFLFSANHEKDAHVLPPDVIKSYLKRGWLKAIEATPLTRRAVDQVVGGFEKMPKFAKDLIARVAPAAAQ